MQRKSTLERWTYSGENVDAIEAKDFHGVLSRSVCGSSGTYMATFRTDAARCRTNRDGASAERRVNYSDSKRRVPSSTNYM